MPYDLTHTSRPLRTLAAAALAVAAILDLSCGPDPAAERAQAQAAQIAQAIIDACPMAAPDDAAAQHDCAERLASLSLLRDAMREPFLWGQQSRLWDYTLADFNTTRFNPLVWRRMYLSLFMFSGGYTVEQVGDLTIVHVPYQFRNGLDPGAYPYPFWHNPNKWRDYQLATELHLVFRGGRIEGALRSAVRLLSRPHTTRDWDGQWTWADGAEPHVSLYRNLFAATNPELDRLETAYRALEGALRPYNCANCHSPDNGGRANPLELFTFPNQALVARHTIRAQLEANHMPPPTDESLGGVPDAAERAQLVQLAREFEAAADAALAAEGQPPPDPSYDVPSQPPPDASP